MPSPTSSAPTLSAAQAPSPLAPHPQGTLRATLDARVLETMAAHAAAVYPEECCGLLLATPEQPLRLARAVPAQNVQTEYNRRNPQSYPRDGRTAFLVEPLALMRAQAEAAAAGLELAGVFHSHIEVGAYFSAEDRHQALLGAGEPLWPALTHVVLDAHREPSGAVVVRALRAFRWDADAREHREIPVEVTP